MNPKKILITGAQGFIGSHLLSVLRARGHTVQAAALNLLDFNSIQKAVEEQNWDVLVHLAGISHVPSCEKDLALAYQTNLSGTALLLEAIQRNRHQEQKPHFIFPSTAQVYEAAQGTELHQGVVFRETHPIRPQNAYARTKWLSEVLLQDTSKKTGMRTTVLRLFNHTHRSQSPAFLLPHLYSLMTQTSPPKDGANGEISIPVGNLDLERDIGSLDDLMAAFTTVIEHPPSSELYQTFNVCSGHVKNLRRLAEGLAKKLNQKVRFIVESSRIRQDEPKSLCGSPEKLTQELGWKSRCLTEEDLIREFLK